MNSWGGGAINRIENIEDNIDTINDILQSVYNYNIYDTTKEIIVGSWDGAPIYRQVVTWQMPKDTGATSANSSVIVDIPWTCSSLKFVVNARAFPAEQTLWQFPLVWYNTSTNRWIAHCIRTIDSKNIHIVFSGDNFSVARKWYIIVDYVK